MSRTQIYHEVPLKASPSAIYTALTDPKLLAKWWIPDTRGESRVGGMLEFWIGNSCQRMKVLALEANRLVSWSAADQEPADWAKTEIAFEIRPDREKCWVRFCHAGLRADMQRLPYYSMSWAVFLLSLKELMETGKGFPFPNRWINQ